MLEDWAHEYLIPRPTRLGGTRYPNWQWPDESFDAALKVIDYRERGFKRSSAVRAQGWLENQKFFCAVIPRKDLIIEFKRARNLLLRHVSSVHGLRADATLSEYKRSALLRQIGPLSPILERAGINPGGALFLTFYELARFGEQITPFDRNNEPLAAALAMATFPSGLHIFAGLLETDETHPLSAMRAIRTLYSDKLEQCRAWAASLPAALIVSQLVIPMLVSNPERSKNIEEAYSAALNSINRWPWAIFSFGAAANFLYNAKRHDLE
jgi:hypothetical protein